ncbi:MAG TPA: hypothetical protein VJH03_05080 [Blastocatellia bacterium]|nr:hypothetical protein [Blastocatellia bacterium]
MRCPKCYTETPNEALCCPGCKLPTPKGQVWKKEKKSRFKPQRAKKAKRIKGARRQVGVLGSVFVITATVLVFGLGTYLAMAFWQESSKPVEPGTPQFALDKLRAMPSSKPELTVEQCLEERVDESSNADRLIEPQGWDIKPIEGSKYKISFTFEEKGNVQQSAEWLVDIGDNTFDPQTDLAKAVTRK